MSYSIPVVPRSSTATAFQLVEGETTATQLREFSDRISAGHYERDERGLVYVTVRTLCGPIDARYGDWIIKDANGNLTVLSGEAFLRLYVPADEDARATLAARDVNDLRVQQAHRIAKGFVASLTDA